MKHTVQIWINAADTLLLMVVSKLPSPRVAQKYRVENLREGPMDDEAAMAIRACDKDGPLMVHVSKKVQAKDKGRFFLRLAAASAAPSPRGKRSGYRARVASLVPRRI